MLVIEINDPHDVLPRRHLIDESFLTLPLLLTLLLDAPLLDSVHGVLPVHGHQYVRLVDKDASLVGYQRALLAMWGQVRRVRQPVEVEELLRAALMAHDT